MYKALLIAVIAALLSGCQIYTSGIAPSSTPITENDTYTIIGPVSTHSFGIVIFGVPFSEDNPSQKTLDRALAETHGDALIEVTQDVTHWLTPYIQPFWTRTQGTAVKVERGGAVN